jgi:hypothetical protein
MGGLEQVFGQGSIIGQQLGLQAFNQQQDQEAMQGAGELQKLFQAEQMNPLKLQQQSLDNQTAQAQLPGHQAQSRSLQQTADFGEATLPRKIKATNSGFDQEIDDDGLKMMENLAQRLLWSKDPKEQALGRQMIADSKEVYADKLKTGYSSDRDERKIRLQGQVQHGLLDKQIAAGRFEKSDTNGGAKSVHDMIASGKLSYEKAATMMQGSAAMLEIEAAAASDPQKQAEITQRAMQYRALADQFAQKAEALRGAGTANPRAGTASVGGLGLPENAARPTAPFAPVPGASAPAAPAAPKQYTPGQTYTGKTGTYQYVGGDPKNPQSWKKVN